MPHERKTLRDAIVAALSGATVAGTQVRSVRVDPTQFGELPAINVYVISDDVDEESITTAPRELKRVAVVAVEGWLAGDADTIDDALDAFALEIETAMDADVNFGGTVSDSILAGTEIKIDPKGEKPIGVVHLQYAVTYFTDQRIAAATDKLQEVDTHYSLEGEQAEDDQAHDLVDDLNP